MSGDTEFQRALSERLSGTAPPALVSQDSFQLALERRLSRGYEPPNRPPDVRHAQGMWESLVSGYETSVTGLALRGREPELVLAENASRTERLLSMAGMVIGDLPAIVIGGIGGGVAAGAVTANPVGAVVGIGSGSMAIPEAARTWLLESYATGADRGTLADRLTATAWSFTKGAAIGGATAGVGARATVAVRAVGGPGILGGAGRQGIITASEAATMVGVASALEQELPTPQSFMDAAVMIGGLRVGIAAGRGAYNVTRAARDPSSLGRALRAREDRLKEIYRRTGVTPEQVVRDAAEDPVLFRQLVDEGYSAIPDRYRAKESSPLAPDEARMLEDGMDPELAAMARNPFGEEIAKNRGRENLNWETFDMADGPKSLADGFAKRYEREFAEETRGTVSHRQTDHEAVGWLREVLGEDGLRSIYEPDSPQWAAELRARKEIVQITLEEAWRRAEAVARLGEKAAPADIAEAVMAMERAKRAVVVFRGRTAEAGRALNILKEKSRVPEAQRNEAEILRALEAFGGKDAALTLAELTAQVRDIKSLAEIASQQTMFESFVTVIKSFMLSAPNTMQVTTLGNVVFAAYRVPETFLAAAYGRLRTLGRPKAERQGLSDSVGFTLGLFKGSWDSFAALGALMRAGVNEGRFGKAMLDAYRNVPISRKLDLLPKKRREALREAAQTKAEAEGLEPGSGPYKSRVSELVEQAVMPELFGGALPKWMGDIIQAPFTVASIGDIHSSNMMRQATFYEAAVRKANSEGLTMGTPAWSDRVMQLVRNPERSVLDIAEKSAERFAFREMGPVAEALNSIVQKVPIIEPLILPFRTAAVAVPREIIRRSPLAPFVKSWREDFARGGAERDKAMAEIIGGMSVMAIAFMLGRDGIVTGSGHPDSRQRRADYNAGFQPYSIRTRDGKQYSLKRWEPVGTLFGLGADIATAWDLMNQSEREDAWTALLWASREVFLNKTWLMGVANAVGAIQNPEMYGERWAEGLAGLVTPNALAYYAREMDPFVREVDGILDAVKSRIPVVRESLEPVRDGFGQPVRASDRAWPGSPTTVRQLSDDPVRIEGARIGMAMPSTPRSLSAGGVMGQSATVDLNPQQRDAFAGTAGETAYDMLSQMMNSPSYGAMPDIAKRRLWARVFTTARRRAAYEVLPAEERMTAVQALMQEEGLVPGG